MILCIGDKMSDTKTISNSDVFVIYTKGWNGISQHNTDLYFNREDAQKIPDSLNEEWRKKFEQDNYFVTDLEDFISEYGAGRYNDGYDCCSENE
jgi:hypothetical protein